MTAYWNQRGHAYGQAARVVFSTQIVDGALSFRVGRRWRDVAPDEKLIDAVSSAVVTTAERIARLRVNGFAAPPARLECYPEVAPFFSSFPFSDDDWNDLLPTLITRIDSMLIFYWPVIDELAQRLLGDSAMSDEALACPTRNALRRLGLAHATSIAAQAVTYYLYGDEVTFLAIECGEDASLGRIGAVARISASHYLDEMLARRDDRLFQIGDDAEYAAVIARRDAHMHRFDHDLDGIQVLGQELYRWHRVLDKLGEPVCGDNVAALRRAAQIDAIAGWTSELSTARMTGLRVRERRTLFSALSMYATIATNPDEPGEKVIAARDYAEQLVAFAWITIKQVAYRLVTQRTIDGHEFTTLVQSLAPSLKFVA